MGLPADRVSINRYAVSGQQQDQIDAHDFRLGFKIAKV